MTPQTSKVVNRCGAVTVFLSVHLFASSLSPAVADTISFQQGVSPSGAYEHGATFVASGGTVVGANTNSNNSSSNSLLVGFDISGLFGTTRSLFEFDVSSIPTTSQIDSASLVLYNRGTTDGSSGSGNSMTLNLRTLVEDFDETTVTWNSLDPDGGSLTGALLASVVGVDPTPGTTGVDVVFPTSTAFVSSVENALAGDGILRMILYRASGDTGWTRFYNEEAGAPAGLRPELIVEFTSLAVVPEPTSLCVWSGLGILMLVGIGLHRRQQQRRS